MKISSSVTSRSRQRLEMPDLEPLTRNHYSHERENNDMSSNIEKLNATSLANDDDEYDHYEHESIGNDRKYDRPSGDDCGKEHREINCDQSRQPYRTMHEGRGRGGGRRGKEGMGFYHERKEGRGVVRLKDGTTAVFKMSQEKRIAIMKGHLNIVRKHYGDKKIGSYYHPHPCSWCGRFKGALITCNGCKSVFYCSRQCAELHMSKGTHSTDCAMLVKIKMKKVTKGELTMIIKKGSPLPLIPPGMLKEKLQQYGEGGGGGGYTKNEIDDPMLGNDEQQKHLHNIDELFDTMDDDERIKEDKSDNGFDENLKQILCADNIKCDGVNQPIDGVTSEHIQQAIINTNYADDMIDGTMNIEATSTAYGGLPTGAAGAGVLLWPYYGWRHSHWRPSYHRYYSYHRRPYYRGAYYHRRGRNHWHKSPY